MAGELMYCWLNDALCPVDTAQVPALDRGFLYGDTLFETLRFNTGKVCWEARHLARIAAAAQRLGFAWRRPVSEVPRLLHAVIDANAENEGVLRLTLSRGSGARGPNPAGAKNPTLLITQSALPDDLDARWHNGYRLLRSPWRKPAPDMLPNWAKHGNYLNSILAHSAAVAAGADDALLYSHDDGIAEAGSSNFFIVRGGVLRTPDASSGALLGVMRSVVLEQAARIGLSAVQERIDETAWRGADEVFLTNAVRGLMPVAAIDDQKFAVPGAWTQQLAEAVREAENT